MNQTNSCPPTSILSRIKSYPESSESLNLPVKSDYTKIHESCFRSYSVLKHIKWMLERWDSKETILDILDFFWY